MAGRRSPAAERVGRYCMLINTLEYLLRTARFHPERLAVRDAAGALNFGQLQSEALLLASGLVRRGIGFNQPVGVYLPKSCHSIVSFAGILMSGNVYAPLDIKTPPERLKGILAKLGPAFVITNEALAPKLREAGFAEENIVLAGKPVDLLEGCERRYERLVDTDPVYIIHTSGSTGLPKGVTICHRGVIDYIEWARSVYPIDETYTIGSQAPFHFDNSTLDIYLSWSTGATLELIPEEMYLFPARLMQHMVERNVDFIFWVPSVLVNAANLDILAKVERPKLRQILFAGEVMPARHLNYWRRFYPEAIFSNLYGPTEITVDCTYWIANRELADGEPVPIGFPCRNSDILILAGDNREAAPGERGELCVRGSSLALGYWNDPERTAAVFTQNPLQTHYPERIYRTGDIVFRNERQEIVFIGRNDSQIKHQGYRIELGEIETAVLSLDGIGNACVLYDRTKSQIVLFYEAGQPLQAAWFRKELAVKIPNYMLPAVYRQMDALPMNANGKIDRVKLNAMLG